MKLSKNRSLGDKTRGKKWKAEMGNVHILEGKIKKKKKGGKVGEF